MSTEPGFFHDLNLDQIVEAITAGWKEYDLKPFFYSRLRDLRAITYRHEVMRDLESEPLFQSIKTFANQMRAVRQHTAAAEKLSYKYQKERWFLDAVEIYGDAIEQLAEDLQRTAPTSPGLIGFREYLVEYKSTDRFKTQRQDAKQLQVDLAAISYCLCIKGSGITVRRYAGEADYSAVIEDVFARFKQGAVKDYRVKFSAHSGMNHVEAQVLDLVAKLNPEIFLRLSDYSVRQQDFLDRTVTRFDREIQFYVAYLEYLAAFKQAGLKFCYPQLSAESKAVSSREGFDLALAGKLVRENKPVICNDFFLHGSERIFVVTGPNQGGKTTFARTFGQLHYLASLGCPVPGAQSAVLLYDQLFTHFEKEENIETLRGKLKDDLVRIHRILEQATPSSVIIMNEIFSSTTVKDAAELARKVVESIARLDALCVCVTFLDELASLSEKTVSMVAAIVPDDPAERSFKLERKPADGLSYALALAEKYRVTYTALKERVKT